MQQITKYEEYTTEKCSTQLICNRRYFIFNLNNLNGQNCPKVHTEPHKMVKGYPYAQS